ncbi:STAS domain-containing protein [Streptomyces sp. NRRL S-646]|uniref:STAS domain-containing protein n=1 Tax=Streptomyces sp. NRRL S-646 TaxID=1463917 RepID=UPI000689C2BB|nr:STAS domain-containing protein [Streptomyces sp. NRRL S-646]
MLTATPLSQRLDALSAGPCPDLVLDLRPVTFIDDSGLRLLCRARNRVLARQGRFRPGADSGRLLRILRPALPADVFEILPDLHTEHFDAPEPGTVSAVAG